MTTIRLRLQSGGGYTSDIDALRSQIRMNGSKPKLEIITISHPGTSKTINLYINLAFEANSSFKISGSLYAVAFGNANGTWHFNIDENGIGLSLPGKTFPGNPDGSYQSLGHSSNLPDITDAKLKAAIESISKYNNEALKNNNNFCDDMARLIIASCEAIRFKEVESKVNNALGKTDTYTPSVKTIHNWNGHMLGY